jgi:hypothetical protein
VAKKVKIELPLIFMLDANWKVTINSKVDNLVVRMAKVDSMATFLAKIKPNFQ